MERAMGCQLPWRVQFDAKLGAQSCGSGSVQWPASCNGECNLTRNLAGQGVCNGPPAAMASAI
eukprot:350616-Chlamydomonas_euryale.AAC.5